ncbi:MAG: riboflavin synthase [Dehalococcoidia bacterium]|jgi:riboflavin synthase
MFTGIIEEVGTVKSLGTNSLSMKASVVLEGTKLGDSVAVDGACLTATGLEKGGFTVEIMPETRKRTTVGGLRVGDKINLERALPAQGRLGGHFVQGHVDATGKVVSLVRQEEAIVASISAPSDVLRYLVNKCFIAVNGVSLTVTDCTSSQFSVSLVTYTRNNSNLGNLKQGQSVNLEVDIMSKYIEKFYKQCNQKGIINVLNQYDYLK